MNLNTVEIVINAMSSVRTMQCPDQESLHLCLQKTLPEDTSLCVIRIDLEYKRGETGEQRI